MNITEIKAALLERFTDGKGPARNAGNDCVYRNSDGNKCAVGCLIPDEHYSPLIECATMTRLEIYYGEFASFRDSEDKALAHTLNASGIEPTGEVLDLLQRAQAIHDEQSYWLADGTLRPDKLRALGLK